jgi:hypothetical protein
MLMTEQKPRQEIKTINFLVAIESNRIEEKGKNSLKVEGKVVVGESENLQVKESVI